MDSLFPELAAAPVSATSTEPSEDELGEAVRWAVALVINKHLIGEPPASMSRADLAEEIIPPTLARCRRWRPGKVILTKYAYVSARFALNDYMEKLHDHVRRETKTKDALSIAAAEFTLYEDEQRLFKLTKALMAHLRSRLGRDVFDSGVVTLEDFERVF